MLIVNELSKRYGSLVALDGVGFDVERGQIIGFLGPNGAGKTTTMRAIMGLVALDSGTVSWDGEPLDRASRRLFGYMPAERGMYPRMKVRDHLVYYARLSGSSTAKAKAWTEAWLDRLGLTDRADDTVQALSSGNQQRVQLALALLGEPDLLVLDEPFSGLDPVAVEMLSDVLRDEAARGAAVLLSSHQLDLVADVASAAVIIDQGKVLLDGDVAALRAESPVRFVDIEFAEPTPWAPTGVAVESGDGRRWRATIDERFDPTDLVSDARTQGLVVAFSYAPPDLSEVFLGLVGRHPSVEHERDGRTDAAREETA